MSNLLRRLFGGDRDPAAVRDVAALAAALSTPAVHVVLTEAPSLSHFGGVPNLRSGDPWPVKNGRKLEFLGRLSLSEIHRAHCVDWLPESGALLFFYDMHAQPWGFDPKDRGGAAVLLVPDLPQPISHLEPGPRAVASPIPFRNVTFRKIDVLPGPERDSLRSLKLSQRETDLLFDDQDRVFQGTPKHQVSGYPTPVQGDDMELECQLVTNGINCGDPSGYNNPRADELRPGAENWKLLFQLDSDDDLGIMWGDCGTLYYWVERQAAREGNFDNTWLILQCS